MANVEAMVEVEPIDVVGGLLQGLFMLLSFTLWLLPIVFAVWVLQRLSAVSRDMTLLKRQLAVIAEHSGAPVVPQPPPPRRPRARLWAFAAVLLAFLLLMGALYAAPGTSWRMEPVELERVGEQGGSSGSATRPMPLPGRVREAPTP